MFEQALENVSKHLFVKHLFVRECYDNFIGGKGVAPVEGRYTCAGLPMRYDPSLLKAGRRASQGIEGLVTCRKRNILINITLATNAASLCR